jgi:membrane-bound serine protease (ClpP class)
LVLGFYALVYEFSTPGIGLGAIAGVICLTLAFFALQVLPLNFAGLTLLVAGFIMMAVDVIVASHGLLIFGGLHVLRARLFHAVRPGSLRRAGFAGAHYRGTLAVSGASSAFVLKKIFEIRKARPVSGAESLVGQTAEVRDRGLKFFQRRPVDGRGGRGPRPGSERSPFCRFGDAR